MPNAEAGSGSREITWLSKPLEYWQTTEGSKSSKERAALLKPSLQEVPA